MRNVNLRGKVKIADRWEESPYRVIRRINPDSPVYVIKSKETVKTRTVHRNLLKHCLDESCHECDEKTVQPEMTKPKREKTITKPKVEVHIETTKTETESGECFVVPEMTVWDPDCPVFSPRSEGDVRELATANEGLSSRTNVYNDELSVLAEPTPGNVATETVESSGSRPTHSVNEARIQAESSEESEQSCGVESTAARYDASDETDADNNVLLQREKDRHDRRERTLPRRSRRSRNPPDRFGEWVKATRCEVLDASAKRDVDKTVKYGETGIGKYFAGWLPRSAGPPLLKIDNGMVV